MKCSLKCPDCDRKISRNWVCGNFQAHLQSQVEEYEVVVEDVNGVTEKSETAKKIIKVTCNVLVVDRRQVNV